MGKGGRHQDNATTTTTTTLPALGHGRSGGAATLQARAAEGRKKDSHTQVDRRKNGRSVAPPHFEPPPLSGRLPVVIAGAGAPLYRRNEMCLSSPGRLPFDHRGEPATAMPAAKSSNKMARTGTTTTRLRLS